MSTPEKTKNVLDEILGLITEYPETITFSRFLEEANSNYKELQLRIDNIYYCIILWETYISIERMYFYNNVSDNYELAIADARCSEYMLISTKDIIPILSKLEDLTGKPTPFEWWEQI